MNLEDRKREIWKEHGHLVEVLRRTPHEVNVEAHEVLNLSLTSAVAMMDDRELQMFLKPETKLSEIFLYLLERAIKSEVSRRQKPKLTPSTNALYALFRETVRAQTKGPQEER